MPGKVLLKKHVQKSKYDPLIEEVELSEANPQYAHIRYPNGKETTVSVRHLAPKIDYYKPHSAHPDPYEDSSETVNVKNDNLNENEQIITETPPNSNESDIKPVLRRSERKKTTTR